MKFLILLLLLISCTDNPADQSAQLTEVVEVIETNSMPPLMNKEEIDYIITELEKTNFSVLDRFFETNELFPYKYIGYFETVSNNVTNYIKPSHFGEIISYTNKYGTIFFNDSQILISKEDLEKIPFDFFRRKFINRI